jgi:hypothetical protein
MRTVVRAKKHGKSDIGISGHESQQLKNNKEKPNKPALCVADLLWS